jgi:hypothetical protein
MTAGRNLALQANTLDTYHMQQPLPVPQRGSSPNVNAWASVSNLTTSDLCVNTVHSSISVEIQRPCIIQLNSPWPLCTFRFTTPFLNLDPGFWALNPKLYYEVKGWLENYS